MGKRKADAAWEKAIDEAIRLYKKDLDLLREYDLKGKTKG